MASLIATRVRVDFLLYATCDLVFTRMVIILF